jgi:hypothetical protein
MRVTKWLPVALLAVLLAIIGAGLLWTTLMMYDDEVYVLYSLRTFCEIGGLYEKVFSQYGPIFYLWNWLLHVAGLDFTNTSARLLTLAYWLVAAGTGAAIVARLTRSAVATAAVLSGVFLHLWPMISEPSHPGGPICAIVGLVAWLGLNERFSSNTRAAWIGAAGAALVLTKINTGIFLLAGAGAWWLLSADRIACSRRWRLTLAGALVLLPLLVMQRLFTEEWVRIFALVTTTAAAATVIALPTRHERSVPLAALWRGALAGLAVTGATVAFIRTAGTSWSALLEGVVLGPLRHPTAYAAFVKWRPGAAVLAAGSILAIAWLVRQPAARRLPWVTAVRLIATSFYLLCWSNLLPLDMHAFALSYGLTAIAWFVLPLRDDDSTAGARGWLALLAVTQALHAFPVAGSQISWGTFLWLPLAALGVHDALQALAARWPQIAKGPLRHLAPVTVAGLVAWNGVAFVRMVDQRLDDSDTLGLPGAASLQLPLNFTSTARILAHNATLHADMLFSLPGMLSFHHWSGVPPPTSVNTTHWFTLLSPAQQEAIRARLEASSRSVLIIQRGVYDFLLETRIATESPLTQWLHANFTRAFSLDSYEFWVRRGRRIAAIDTAQLFETDAGASPRYKLTLFLAHPDLRDVARITLDRLEGDGQCTLGAWDRQNATILLTSVDSAGGPCGPVLAAAWPFQTKALVRVELFTDFLPAGFRADHSIIHLRDATGRTLAEARFAN